MGARGWGTAWAELDGGACNYCHVYLDFSKVMTRYISLQIQWWEIGDERMYVVSVISSVGHTDSNIIIVTFCVSRRRRKMYCGHAHLCVCLSVRGRTPTLLHGPGCNLGHGRGCPLVVHYWADLQSALGLRCYGNITRTLVTSLHPSRDMTT